MPSGFDFFGSGPLVYKTSQFAASAPGCSGRTAGGGRTPAGVPNRAALVARHADASRRASHEKMARDGGRLVAASRPHSCRAPACAANGDVHRLPSVCTVRRLPSPGTRWPRRGRAWALRGRAAHDGPGFAPSQRIAKRRIACGAVAPPGRSHAGPGGIPNAENRPRRALLQRLTTSLEPGSMLMLIQGHPLHDTLLVVGDPPAGRAGSWWEPRSSLRGCALPPAVT